MKDTAALTTAELCIQKLIDQGLLKESVAKDLQLACHILNEVCAYHLEVRNGNQIDATERLNAKIGLSAEQPKKNQGHLIRLPFGTSTFPCEGCAECAPTGLSQPCADASQATDPALAHTAQSHPQG